MNRKKKKTTPPRTAAINGIPIRSYCYKETWTILKKSFRDLAPVFDYKAVEHAHRSNGQTDYEECFEDMILWVTGLYTISPDAESKKTLAPLVTCLLELKNGINETLAKITPILSSPEGDHNGN